MYAISTDNLTKHYGRVRALRGLKLEVAQGTVFGFLGANGAGKTTAIRLLLGLIKPTSGTATVLGRDAMTEGADLRREVGYLPGELTLYPWASGQELIGLLGGFYPETPWRRELCDALEMPSADLRRPVREYSTGMKQKLGIIQALQHAPRLAILDEPTRGLDPVIQRSFFDLIRRINGRGTTVFMSTHILSDVEQACDRVAIIRAGELLVTDDVDSLRHRKVHRFEVTLAHATDMSWVTEAGASLTELSYPPATYVIETADRLDAVLRRLGELPVVGMVSERARLEDVFLRYYAGQEDRP